MAGRWLLSGAVGALLLGVAATDLYRLLRPRPAPDHRLLAAAELRFEPRDWLVDLRSRAAVMTDVAVGPIHELTEGWGQTTPDGARTVGERAVITLRPPVGGQRVIWLECRPDRRPGPGPRLEVAVNGIACGGIDLDQELGPYRVELQRGVVVPGSNRVALALLEGQTDRRPAAGRSLELRRLVLAEAPATTFEEVASRAPVRLDRVANTVLLAAPGRLLVRFEVTTPGSTLALRRWFKTPDTPARGRLGVGRWFEEPGAVDTIGESSFGGDADPGPEERLYLGHHVGPALLWIEAEFAGAQAGLVVASPRLETDRS